MTDTQPPITPDSGIVSTPWHSGPRDGTANPVVVSYTDFRANSVEDLQQIIHTGTKLGENWPVMHGAVGLWLWAKPAELRGGSLSIWETREDLHRFIRWPTHVAIIRRWRERIEVRSESWEDERFVADDAWSRAEAHMRQPRDMTSVPAPAVPDNDC